MKKYVYMIDYKDNYGADQIECYDIKDLTTQLKILAKENNSIVENVKLVENQDRWHEEDISFSLAKKVIRILSYKPVYMTSRGKGKYTN